MRHRSPRLSWQRLALLLAGAPTLAAAAEPPAWVFFADRGLEGAALTAAVEARAAELSPRALERRRRVRGDRGVDVRDLAPDPDQVAAVLGTGARLRSSSRWLNAVSVDADGAQLAAIAVLPAVVRIQSIARRRVTRLGSPRAVERLERGAAPQWTAGDEDYGVALDQLRLLRVPTLHRCGLTGAGVVVGVQDSGFSLQHAALAGVDVVAARDFLNDDDEVADEPGDPEGQHDHGTMILSLLVGDDPGNFMGAAPGISVILSKTEDSSLEQPFEEDRFVEGLEWVESMGADLFTSSLGYVDWYEPQDFDGETAVTTRAATVAVEQGLIMFSPIGNAGPAPMTLIAPSDADGVIAVGAVDREGAVSDFSSRGPSADGRIKPDIAAPGQSVWVVVPDSQTDYAKGNGTSLAAPLAAGAAALLMEAIPGLDPTSMRAMLQQSSSLAGAPNNELGWGLLDASLPLAHACGCADADDDGALAVACGGDDCDDADPSVAPGLVEVCDDGHDNDCNQRIDDDDPACAGTSGGPATSGAPAPGEPDAGHDDEAASSDGAPGEGHEDAATEGCACSGAPETWPPALLLMPWLLFGVRRRPAAP